MKNKINDLYKKDSNFFKDQSEYKKKSKFKQKNSKKLFIKNKLIFNAFNKYYKLLIYILIIIFLPLYLLENNYISSISLNIFESGENKIISDSFEYFPDKIIINNEEIPLSNNVYDFENTNNNIL